MAIVVFAAFTVVTIYETLFGVATCGCLGHWSPRPKVMAALDVVALSALLVTRPPADAQGGSRLLTWTIVMTGCILAIASIPLSLVGRQTRPIALEPAAAWELTSDGTAILEPARWVGRPLPLLAYVDVRDQLQVGDWMVVLVHHDCDRCLEWLDRYRATVHKPTVPLAVIEVPPFALSSDIARIIPAGAIAGKLKPQLEWFVETPAVIRLSRGQVVRSWNAQQEFENELAGTAALPDTPASLNGG